jgi:hypothetical protein
MIFMIFGVIGIKLFKGKLYHCVSEHIIGLEHARVEAYIEDKFSCINFGGEWVLW